MFNLVDKYVIKHINNGLTENNKSQGFEIYFKTLSTTFTNKFDRPPGKEGVAVILSEFRLVSTTVSPMELVTATTKKKS